MLSVETVANERYENPLNRAVRFVGAMQTSAHRLADQISRYSVHNPISKMPLNPQISDNNTSNINNIDHRIVTGLSYLHIVGRAHTASVRLRA